MAVWRTKAYELFGFKPGSYSTSRGKFLLFDDLVAMARRALLAGDQGMLRRIVDYVSWTDRQTSDKLVAALEGYFLLPIFRDSELCTLLRPYFPQDFFLRKWRILMVAPDQENDWDSGDLLNV